MEMPKGFCKQQVLGRQCREGSIYGDEEDIRSGQLHLIARHQRKSKKRQVHEKPSEQTC